MIETRRVRERRLGAAAAWVVLLGAVGGLAGCGDPDAASEAVRVSAMEIETLSLGGANPAPLGRDDRLATLEKIVGRLRPHATGSGGGTQAAVNTLMARAQATLSGMQAEDLAFASRRTLDGVTSVRGLLDRYLSEHAAAGALEQYDPGPELAALDEQIRSREEEIARVVQDKQALEKELADLDAKATTESEHSRARRLEETALRARAVNLKAVEQAELIGQATEQKRAADGHDMQGSLLRAQIAQRQPEVGEFQTLIDRLREQRRLLDEAKAEVQAFAKSTADRAAASRAAAGEAAKAIGDALTQLEKAREPIEELSERVLSGYDQAARAARAAGTSGEARLSEASNKHAEADVRAMLAQGQRAYADLLRDLADATPELTGIADLRKRADGAEERAANLTTEAATALGEATEAYANANARGEETQQRLERLAQKLAELKNARENPGSVPSEPAPGAAPTGPGDTAAAAPAGGEEAEIRAMLEELTKLGASAEFSAAAPYLHASSDAGRDFMAFGEKIGGASADLNKAMTEKFGSGMGEMPGMSGPMNFDFAGVPINVISPTAATLSVDGGGAQVPVAVVKVDGRWKLDVDSIATALGPSMEPLKRMADPLAAAMRQVAADVRAGTYSTKEEAQQALMTQIGTLMMEAGRGGG